MVQLVVWRCCSSTHEFHLIFFILIFSSSSHFFPASCFTESCKCLYQTCSVLNTCTYVCLCISNGILLPHGGASPTFREDQLNCYSPKFLEPKEGLRELLLSSEVRTLRNFGALNTKSMEAKAGVRLGSWRHLLRFCVKESWGAIHGLVADVEEPSEYSVAPMQAGWIRDCSPPS